MLPAESGATSCCSAIQHVLRESTMSYTSRLDLPYAGAQSPRQALDLYLPFSSSSTSPPPLLVYVHGGAWRSESKEDFRKTLAPLLLKQTNLPLAILDYRLAPSDPHPAQITDVLSGLDLLTASTLLPGEGDSPKWDRSRIILLGHSAGAFMCLQVLFDPPKGSCSPPASKQVRDAVEKAFLIDGIYDLPSLLDEYPSYLSFVSDAFGPPSSVDAEEDASSSSSSAQIPYALESPARWSIPSTAHARRTELHILHSKEDELLSLAQPDFLLQRLSSLGAFRDRVKVDYETLKGGHYEVVHTKAEALARYVAQALERGGAESVSKS
ncbi:hypothetical protein JCM10908_003130 [Rhodotorula pacifica]|uniref:alpha/beta hydrolase n=1 Tax=Rhodotorula pacifica TaxID=1495444 RepID=UPI00317EF0C6